MNGNGIGTLRRDDGKGSVSVVDTRQGFKINVVHNQSRYFKRLARFLVANDAGCVAKRRRDVSFRVTHQNARLDVALSVRNEVETISEIRICVPRVLSRIKYPPSFALLLEIVNRDGFPSVA